MATTSGGLLRRQYYARSVSTDCSDDAEILAELVEVVKLSCYSEVYSEIVYMFWSVAETGSAR